MLVSPTCVFAPECGFGCKEKPIWELTAGASAGFLTLACIEFDTHEFSRQNRLQFAASIEMLFFQIEPYSWLKFQCRCNAT
jgi:hypothetical protein